MLHKDPGRFGAPEVEARNILRIVTQEGRIRIDDVLYNVPLRISPNASNRSHFRSCW